MTKRQIEKPGKVDRRNILRSSYMTFYQIGQMDLEKWLRTDERTDGAATICSPFGKHKNKETFAQSRSIVRQFSS